ncbi:MAG: FkbM family methyltransferase, partial [Patescibacteria group bacterium]
REMNSWFFEGSAEQNFIGHQAKEIYFDRIYAPFVEGKKDLTFLDLGANLGLVSYYFSQFAKKIFSVEPSAEHFACLSRMVSENKLEEIITPINKAIYLKSGKFPLFHNTNRTMRSLHTAVHDNSSPPETVDCITLDQLFDEYKIDHVDLLKLDIEGTEAEVLASEGFAKVADKIDLIIGESHNWMGRHSQQLIDALESRGFVYSVIPGDAQLFCAQKK